jgi:hypothetical protein
MPSLKKASPRPPASFNDANWKTSKAKQLIAQDIIDGRVPVEGNIDIEELFQREYAGHDYFKNFPFDII